MAFVLHHFEERAEEGLFSNVLRGTKKLTEGLYPLRRGIFLLWVCHLTYTAWPKAGPQLTKVTPTVDRNRGHESSIYTSS